MSTPTAEQLLAATPRQVIRSIITELEGQRSEAAAEVERLDGLIEAWKLRAGEKADSKSNGHAPTAKVPVPEPTTRPEPQPEPEPDAAVPAEATPSGVAHYRGRITLARALYTVLADGEPRDVETVMELLSQHDWLPRSRHARQKVSDRLAQLANDGETAIERVGRGTYKLASIDGPDSEPSPEATIFGEGSQLVPPGASPTEARNGAADPNW